MTYKFEFDGNRTNTVIVGDDKYHLQRTWFYHSYRVDFYKNGEMVDSDNTANESFTKLGNTDDERYNNFANSLMNGFDVCDFCGTEQLIQPLAIYDLTTFPEFVDKKVCKSCRAMKYNQTPIEEYTARKERLDWEKYMDRIILSLEELGLFEITSKKLLATDPTFEVGDDNVLFDNAKIGRWIGYLIKNKQTNLTDSISLIVKHEKYSVNISEIVWEENFEVKEIGVDSARAGVFDYKTYEPLDYPEENQETFKNGLYVRAGMGDGGYEVFYKEHENEVVAVKIEFVDLKTIAQDMASNDPANIKKP